jgi:hypothetical protein
MATISGHDLLGVVVALAALAAQREGRAPGRGLN